MDNQAPAPISLLTAYAVMGLCQGANYGPSAAPIARALRYFESAQRPDGSFQSLWFRGLVAGTAFVLDAYATLGLSREPVARRCQQWLLAHQNSDGSWGKSQQDPNTGTVEETAWALAALARCSPFAAPDSLDKAAQWLAKAQLPDGGWEPNVIGVYFNEMYFSSDHMANGYILQALGRYLNCSTLKIAVPSNGS
jgi:squalene-hopene/tetraprenyl-beta-curcumene cyclase